MFWKDIIEIEKVWALGKQFVEFDHLFCGLPTLCFRCQSHGRE